MSRIIALDGLALDGLGWLWLMHLWGMIGV